MVRIKRGNVARKRRKKILAMASGYRGAHSVLFRVANQQVMKALRYSYIGRKQKNDFLEEFGLVELMLLLVLMVLRIVN
jgi:large subunit ribosomal protein L20